MTRRGIVVDTSVARAAGKGRPSANSPAPECVAVLAMMLERATCQKDVGVAMSRAMKNEWSKNVGEYAVKWLYTMMSRKCVVIENSEWEGCDGLVVAAAVLPGAGQREVQKDAHVVGLAMLTGCRVVSLDDKQRRLLLALCSSVVALKRLHWVSPKDADARDWVRDGAPECVDFCLVC